MSKKVYVSASSHEIDRAKRWMAALRETGITVTSTWPEVITAAGDANPAGAPMGQRKEWAITDLLEVDQADVLWLLSPIAPTSGAWVELGYAYAKGKGIYGSYINGDLPHNSIFTGLAKVWCEDLLVFQMLKELYS